MRKLLRRFRVQRYQDPSLHPGVWHEPEVVTGRGGTRIVWRIAGGGTICTGTNHGAHVCTIGPGVAHEDTCMCGAKRYGVFGTWS